MFCPNCGSEVKDDDLFCGECGAKIEHTEVPESEPVKKEAAPQSESGRNDRGNRGDYRSTARRKGGAGGKERK